MKTFAKIALVAALGVFCATTLHAAEKNWTPPAYKIQAQKLSDEIMAKHPELLSVTFHGVPPGLSKIYTMFAGSFPERIGNADDPVDVMVVELGITIVDPRWNRPKDSPRKFVMMVPLRDAAGGHVGLLVLAYKNPVGSSKSELEFFSDASKLRDGLQKQIPSYASLFAQVK